MHNIQLILLTLKDCYYHKAAWSLSMPILKFVYSSFFLSNSMVYSRALKKNMIKPTVYENFNVFCLNDRQSSLTTQQHKNKYSANTDLNIKK